MNSPRVSIRNFLTPLLIIAPAVLGFLYVFFFGVNVAFGDQFDGTVPLLGHGFSGTLGFSDFWSRHNEHIIFFPRMLMLLLARLTAYNTRVEMFASELLLCISLLALVLAAKSQFGFNFRSMPLWLAPLSLLIFDWSQRENMLWGFQVAFVLVQTTAILTGYFLFMLTRSKTPLSAWGMLVLAILSGSVCSFSSSMGFFIWISGVLQLALSPVAAKKRWGYLMVFALAGLLHWYLFLSGYHHPSYHPSPLFFAHHPINFAFFLFACQGTPVILKLLPAALSGIAILSLMAIAFWKVFRNGSVGRNAFWIGLMSFSLLAELSISIGRAGFGPRLALASRYSTFALPAIIGLYVLAVDLRFRKTASRLPLRGAIVLLILLGVAYNYASGLKSGIHDRKEKQECAFILYTYETQPDTLLRRLCNNDSIIRTNAAVLRRLNLNVFSGTMEKSYPDLSTLPEKSSPLRAGEVDSIKAFGSGTDLALSVKGHILEQCPTASGIYLEIDGKRFSAYRMTAGIPARVLRLAGKTPVWHFERTIPASLIGPGDHLLRLGILSDDRQKSFAGGSISFRLNQDGSITAADRAGI